jgi:hypothetical protein
MHDVYMLEIAARTIEAILEPHRPYVDSIAVRRFSLDLRDPTSYVDVLLRMLEPWAVLARSALKSKVTRPRTDVGRNHATSTQLHRTRHGIRVEKPTENRVMKQTKAGKGRERASG